MMKQTSGGVKLSLVDHRVASGGAFLLVLGQVQVQDICTQNVLFQGWPRAEPGGRGGNPSRAVGKGGL